MEDDYKEVKFSEDYKGHSYAIEGAAVYDDPIDKIEPVLPLHDYDKGFKDAVRRYPYVLNAAISFILNSDNLKVACYQVAFALGLALCAGKSMEQLAKSLGTCRANLSKGAKAFGRSLNLPPSTYMKSTLAVEAAREARIESIKDNNKEK